jgi:hypothetical protein
MNLVQTGSFPAAMPSTEALRARPADSASSRGGSSALRRAARALRGDSHRLAAVALEDAFAFEQAVDLRDRHRMDGVLERELADRRQGRARRARTV